MVKRTPLCLKKMQLPVKEFQREEKTIDNEFSHEEETIRKN